MGMVGGYQESTTYGVSVWDFWGFSERELHEATRRNMGEHGVCGLYVAKGGHVAKVRRPGDQGGPGRRLSVQRVGG